MFEKLLPVFLENGGELFNYDKMTYGEIMMTIDANRSRVKQEMQIQANMLYTHARLVSYSFADPGKMPSLHEAFPSLFEAPAIAPEPKQQDWRLMKDIMLGYSEQHNDKIKNKG